MLAGDLELPALVRELLESRAFWIASADWVANVWSSWIVSGGNSPGVFLLTVRPHVSWSSRSIGMARTARVPLRRRTSRWAVAAGGAGRAVICRDLQPRASHIQRASAAESGIRLDKSWPSLLLIAASGG